MAKRKSLTGFIEKSRRDRKQRIRSLGSLSSWVFIGLIGLFVVLLLAQFIGRLFVNPRVDSQIERNDLLVHKGERIQLIVLNGSGEKDLARTFTEFLRARQFDVVSRSNFERSNVEESFIIDKINDTVSAKKVAFALGIAEDHISHITDSNAFVEAAVVIGKDFKALRPMQ